MAGVDLGAAVNHRVHDWQSRLQAVIAERMFSPSSPGVLDCAIFAACCVEACTGVQHLLADDVCPTTMAADLRIARGGGMERIVTSRLGKAIAPALAAVGDVGMFEEGARHALAVQVGGAWLAPGADGLRVVQPALVLAAWRCEGG